MDQNFGRTDLLPVTVPSMAIWVMAIVGLAIWLFVHRLIVRKRLTQVRVRLGILIPLGTAATWAILQLMGRYLFLSGHWHLLFSAFLTGASLETVSYLYQRESSRMKKKIGLVLVACRMSAILIVLFMLLQPVLVGDRSRTIRRRVAVLLDDSASMNFTDKYWTLEEKLDVASALGLLNEEGAGLVGFGDKLSALSSRFGVMRQLAADAPDSLVKADVAALVKDSLDLLKPKSDVMEQLAQKISEKDHFELRDNMGRVSRHVKDVLIPALEKLGEQAALDKPDLRSLVANCADSVEQVSLVAPTLERAGYVVAFDNLGEAEKAKILTASDTTRADIARRLLTEKGNKEDTLVRHLRTLYDLDIYRFASTAQYDSSFGAEEDGTTKPAEKKPVAKPESTPAEKKNGDEKTADEKEQARTEAFRSSTDITAALETALREIPSEELAGVLILSDGRHNGDAGVDAVSRRMGSAGIPISSIIIGGSKPPVDVAIGSARSPESVFLGDKVRVNGTIVATGASGKETKIRLMLGDQMLEEQTVFIENNDFVKEFRFTHTPEDKGVLHYKVVVDHIDGEEFKDNNDWMLDVSVTDDRTNVLLVDSHPRWEFRYLRNLFYGRDKSVHLQEYLIHPDTIAGQPEVKLPPASASRKFGDSESGSYPKDRSEWRKFDVIIIGDLNSDELPDPVVEEIRYCVEERGALLVVIAGPEAMPHKIRNETLRRMLPIVYTPSEKDYRLPPEAEFNFSLTPSGRGHQVMTQSSSSSENESIWQDLPIFGWRYPVDGVKPGAEVLAYAVPVRADNASLAQLAVRDLEGDPEAAVRRLADLRQTQANNSLVVAQTCGQGKVLMLNTDRTWRLRYRVGDTRHHQFWGQVLRWGTGEKLRAGNPFVRLGSDRLRYKPTDPVKIFARIVDQNFNSMSGLKPTVVLSSGDRDFKAIQLDFRKDSNGFYEGVLDPIADPGVYKLRLDCPRAKRELGTDYPDKIETHFVVVTAEKPAEFVSVTANRDIPIKMAKASDGKVVGPSEIASLWNDFGEGNRVMHDRTELYLWDSGWLFAVVIGLLTAEWIIRKRSGIA